MSQILHFSQYCIFSVKRDAQSRTNNFSKLLLSRLSNFDAKDIRQNIDVKHKNEEIYGDPRFESNKGDTSTGNFDSVKEDIDLVMQEGKAFITITATAERFTPVDLEFNIWRKSQAIVTRVIEIDFQANEQRRMMYETVMSKAGGTDDIDGKGRGQGRGEKVLTSQETLDVFSELMGATGGQGDHEDITVKTSARKTAMLPQDFLY